MTYDAVTLRRIAPNPSGNVPHVLLTMNFENDASLMGVNRANPGRHEVSVVCATSNRPSLSRHADMASMVEVARQALMQIGSVA